MTEKIFSNAAVKSVDSKSRTVEVIASTSVLDRDGEILDQNTWQLEHYKQNPVVLWAHDCDELPIGKCVEIGVVDGALKAVIEFAPESINPKAEQIYQAINAGFIRALSVGFKPHSYEWAMFEDREVLKLSQLELHEISVVNVGANQEALVVLRAKALANKPKQKETMEKEDKELIEAALELAGKKSAKEATPVITALQEKLKSYDTLQKRFSELEAQYTGSQKKAVIEKALREGRLTPAHLDESTEQGKRFKRLSASFSQEQLEDYIATLPTLPQPVEQKSSQPGVSSEVTLTEQEISTGKAMGHTVEVLLASKKSLQKSA